MRKVRFMNLVVILACLCILSLSVPNAMAAERDGKIPDFKTFVAKSMGMFSSFFSFLRPVSNDESSGEITACGTISKPRFPDDSAISGPPVTPSGTISKPRFPDDPPAP